MKDEIAMKKEYKETFGKLCAPEELHRKVRELSEGSPKKRGIPLLKKLAVAAAIVIVLFLGSNGIAYATTGKTWMGYLIKPGTEEWVKLGTVENKKEACRIPEETLKKMTNEELIEAVLDYPFLVDLYVFGLQSEAVYGVAEQIYEECDALRELLSRKDGEEDLRAFWEERTKHTPKDGVEEFENEAIRVLLEALCD